MVFMVKQKDIAASMMSFSTTIISVRNTKGERPMTEELRKACLDLAVSIAREETVKPFLLELADLFEKYKIVLVFENSEPVNILDYSGNTIYEMNCLYMTPESLRTEAEQ